jgi:hypothetical protein
MTPINSPFLKVQVEGTTMLINMKYIVSAHFKSTAFVELKMVNGDAIKVPAYDRLFDHIQQQHQPLGNY